jgi:hypothetical protein
MWLDVPRISRMYQDLLIPSKKSNMAKILISGQGSPENQTTGYAEIWRHYERLSTPLWKPRGPTVFCL